MVVDEGSPFKGILTAMCQLLSIPCVAAAPQNHRTVQIERFFGYLNRVERITAANTQSFTAWLQGVLFAIYGWNATPVDGTNLVRSFVAKGRIFPFPINLALNPIPPTLGIEGPSHTWKACNPYSNGNATLPNS